MSEDTSQPAGFVRGRSANLRAGARISRSGTTRHRHRHKHRRRRDLRWLAIGILAPLPLVALVVLVAHSSRSAMDADQDALAEAISSTQQSIASPGIVPAIGPTPRCPPAGEVIPAIVEAAACGDPTRLQDALARQESLTATDPRRSFAGFTALHHVAARGDLDGLRTLLEAGAQANQVDANGDTPLHLLALGDRILSDEELARVLIGAGADPDRKNRNGLTALEALLATPRHAAASPGLLSALTDHAHQIAVLDRARSYLAREGRSDNRFRPLQLAGSGLAGKMAEAPPPATGTPAAPPPANRPLTDEAALRGEIEAWAHAWNARRADEVLAHYGVDFTPADGTDRANWEAVQRQGISRAEWIELTVTDLRVEVREDRASAYFVQGYAAPGQRKDGSKILEFRRSEAGWKIIAERDGS